MLENAINHLGSDIDHETGNSIKRDGKKPNIKLGKEIARGGNSIVYDIEGDPDHVVAAIGESWGGVAPERMDKAIKDVQEMMELYKKVPEGVNAPKIVDVWTENGRLFKRMEKAKGEVVHDRKGDFRKWQKELETVANAPASQYEKLVSDVKTLSEVGFMIDPSKPDNILYDKDKGFQLIDLSPGYSVHSLKVPLIHTFNFFTKYKEHMSEVKGDVLKIIDNLNQAGDVRNEYTEDEIIRVISEIDNTMF